MSNQMIHDVLESLDDYIIAWDNPTDEVDINGEEYTMNCVTYMNIPDVITYRRWIYRTASWP